MTETYHEEHLLDRAAMLAMRAMIAVQPSPSFGPGGRPAFDELMAGTPAADCVRYEAASVGGVPGWWCRPTDADAATAILYLHGGAYLLGSAEAYRNFVSQIARRASAAAFIPDYALAPERPYPSAVDDAVAVYRGLASQGYLRIAVAGDSAGGGLALVAMALTMAASRDGSIPVPRAAAVMSPWTDLAVTGESSKKRAPHDPLLDRETLLRAAKLYLGRHEAEDPAASPLRGDLAGLPPVLLHVGEDEILLDDARRYADYLSQAGGSAELHVWQGMVHVFPANLAMLRAAREALDLLGDFLRRHLDQDHSPSEGRMS